MSPALTGGFFTTEPPGKPIHTLKKKKNNYIDKTKFCMNENDSKFITIHDSSLSTFM